MAEQTKEYVFDLPSELAIKYKKKEFVVDVPANATPQQQESIANKAYDEWYFNQETMPSQQQAPVAPKPTVTQAIGAGVGKSAGDIWAGLKQLGYGMQKIPGELGSTGYTEAQGKQDILARQQAEKAAEYEKIRQQRPIAAGFGEVLPTALTKSPLLVGVSEAAKYGEPGERLTKGAFGGLTAGLGNWIGGRFVPYVNPQVNESSLKAIREAESLGVQPRLSEITGSRGIAKLEDVVAQAPFGESMLKPQYKNQLKFNETAAKSIGEKSQLLTEDVLANASARIGQVYNNVATTEVPIRFTKSVENAADEILKRQNAAKRMNLTEAENPQLTATANAWKLKAQRGEAFTGADYNLTRENLSKLAWAAEGSERKAYRDLLNALDDAAEQSLVASGENSLANQLKVARQQYANLKTIEKGNVVKNGDIDIKLLRNAIKQGKESAYKEGKLVGDLSKLAKYSEATAPIREGSQTAGRSFYQQLLSNPVTEIPLSGLNALFAGALSSPVSSYVPRKLAGTAAGKVAGEVVERGAKLPALQGEQGFLIRRLFQPPQGLLQEEQ
jgi:hypothetical protein